MKLVWVTWLAALIMLAFSAVAQNDNQPELPSAPSAVQEQKEPPKSAPSQAQKSAPTRPQSSWPSDIQELKPIGQEAPPTAPAVPDTTASKPDPQEPTAAPASPSSEAKPSPSGDADSAENDKSLTTIRKTVNEVNVVFVVTDKHGHYVKDLKKDNFRVLDDNKPAKEIRSFRNETDLPLQVGLLVDASNSVRDRFKFEQEAAIEFLNQIIRPSYDKAFVIGFDTTPEITQDFTDSTELLSRGCWHLARASRGRATKFWSVSRMPPVDALSSLSNYAMCLTILPRFRTSCAVNTRWPIYPKISAPMAASAAFKSRRIRKAFMSVPAVAITPPTIGEHMAGYSGTPLPQKLGIRTRARIALPNTPPDVKIELKAAMVGCEMAGQGPLDF